MSAPDLDPKSPPALALTEWALDVTELAALPGQGHALAAHAASRGVPLPAAGRVAVSRPGSPTGMALCVRPERWLLLTTAASAESAGAAADGWHAPLAGIGAALDQSSGWCALRLAGDASAIGAALARGCRLDLDPQVFPVGQAAATIIAQVPVILARLADGMLLLTPATTARHFREWLGAQLSI